MISVCAEVVVRNEALFLEESLRSIANVFDEIIVVDHGSVDETIDILHSVKSDIPQMSIHCMDGRTSFAHCRNFVAENTRCDWVWKWDADFVAYDDDDPRSPLAFLPRLAEFDKRGHNMVLLHCPNCGPTFETTLSSQPKHGHNGDIKLMRRDIVRYVTGRYADTYSLPENASLDRAWVNHDDSIAYFIHLTQLKLIERLVIRQLMFDQDKARFLGQSNMDFHAWLDNSGRGSLFDMIETHMARLRSEAVPFDFERWGPHPSILANARHKVPFRIVDGTVQETEVRAAFPKLWNWLTRAVLV